MHKIKSILRKITSYLCIYLIFINSTLTPLLANTLFVSDSQNQKEVDMSALRYVEHKSGGTGGVHVFEEPETNQKWTLKSWTSYDHGVNEMLGALLLAEMGLKTPDFMVLDSLPDALKSQCTLEGKLFRLARYVKGETPSEADLQTLLPSSFLPISVASFWDIKPENFILTPEGQLVLIDTGSALLYRSLGAPKKEGVDGWSKYQITDLKTLKDHQKAYFGTASYEVMLSQIPSILSKAEHLLDLTDSFCRQLQYKDRQTLISMLSARFQHAHLLSQVSQGVLYPNSDRFSFGAAGYDAAGTLTYTIKDKLPHILIAQRAKHKWVVQHSFCKFE